MQNLKQSRLLNSFRKKALLALALLAVSVTLFFILKSKYPGIDLKPAVDSISTTSNGVSEKPQIKQVDLKTFKAHLDGDIDSILATFGIKREWIATITPQQKEPPGKPTAPNDKSKAPKTKPVPKRNPTEAEWFVKDVSIPKDLASAEVNLDISLYVTTSGYIPVVNEDIKTKDIIIDIKKSSDTLSAAPLARVYVTHSDKAVRETGTFCLILSSLGDYKKDEIDNVLSSTNDFTFTFPRNLENIELQNRLVQSKKDLVINLTESGKDNSAADFTTTDDKDIRQKVKSFSVDYPGVTKVILTKIEGPALPQGLTWKITSEFAKYNIRVINDSALTNLLGKADEDSKDKIRIIINNIRTKALQTGKAISILNLSYDDFTKLSDELLTLKKLGYRFYNLTDYLNKEAELKKKEIQSADKNSKDKAPDKKNAVKPEKKTSKPEKKTVRANPKVKTQKPNAKKK